ncbi:hypothetical protein GCM10025864_02790 [Luteimicrobium album]|uniref:Pentapeptide repeat-containing protein n=1 Tax=Luteimicrobium album TaxID=1054550 RepID=A0ABQ6HVZ9_9MICO|nr:pentapeptide repeat-containing protein [Luteimicrobium album]GMA22520.1 hypothetical protein GCM10025864_02790 [Luteimicrobium album]
MHAEHAVLVSADLAKADFVQATLTGADLRGATLREAHAGQADFLGARLDGADLTDADLTQADLTGASVDGTILSHADLTQTTRPEGYRDADGSGDAPLDAIAALATLLLALAVVVPALRSAARRRRGGKDLRGTGPAAVLAGVVVLAGAVALAAYELRADPDWTDVLMVLPMITVLVFAALFAGLVISRARWGVVGALSTGLGLAGYFVLVSTIMSALLGSVFGEYPRAPSCTAATCAWGYSRGWTGAWVGLALLALCSLVGRLTRRRGRVRPARVSRPDPTGVATPVAAPSPDDVNAAAYQAVRDFRKG